jgi:hypothetical protein
VDTVDQGADVPTDPWFDYPPDYGPDYPPDYWPDYPPDLPPDTTCISEGCTLPLGGMCCPGLVPASECDPSGGDPECTMVFCIRDGDGVCGPHENCYNSVSDCDVPPCDGPESPTMSYSCGMIESHHCTCGGGECRPACMSDSTGNSGWFDPCSDTMIRADDCRGQTAVCRDLCTSSEGWYESTTSELIARAMCEYRWVCEVVW